jgi:DoxX-like family
MIPCAQAASPAEEKFMPSTNETASTKMLWAGRILSALPVMLMLFGGVFCLLKPAAIAPGFAHYGYPEGALLRISIVELACAILYAIPSTSVLGAILITGYLGGATATHVRVGEPFFIPIVLGVVVWAGLFLRDDRLRALVPLRS